MIKVIHFSLIPGVMAGFEWDYDNKFFVFDLLILRIVVDYWPYDREDTPE